MKSTEYKVVAVTKFDDLSTPGHYRIQYPTDLTDAPFQLSTNSIITVEVSAMMIAANVQIIQKLTHYILGISTSVYCRAKAHNVWYGWKGGAIIE